MTNVIEWSQRGLKTWIRAFLFISGLQNDPLHLDRLRRDWKYRQSWRNGLALLSMNLVRSGAKLYDLFFCPRLFVRYLTATVSLHIVYEVVKRMKRMIVQLALQSTGEGRKIYNLRKQLTAARNFNERHAIGTALDQLEGKEEWKNQAESTLYDYKRVIGKTQMYKRLRHENDITGLMFYLRAGLLRKHWGLGNPRLYGRSHVGTKKVIEEYMDTVKECMDTVLEAQPTAGVTDQEFSAENKLAFFNETRHAFGRSALLLSGGGSMGMYHAGVIKALAEQSILPTVISGASAGSIVAGIVCVRMDEEILKSFTPGVLNFRFFGTNIDEKDKEEKTPEIIRKLKPMLDSSSLLDNIHGMYYLLQRWTEKHYILDINVLKACVRRNIGDYTFREAYDRTGRIVNMTVTPTQSSDYPQLLNYLTAPNVLVWSASIASCAIPGIFSPVELLAKDKHGNITPYHPEGLKWSDGSLECDLPMERLSELFNVNHFIVSQVNIHYKAISGYSSFGTGKLNDLLGFFKKQMKAYIKHIVELGFNTSILRFLRVGWVPLLTQSYEGDITICANGKVPWWKMLINVLKNPTPKEYEEILITGERATWEYISRIRTMCQIEFALERAVRQLRGELAIKQAKHGHNMTRVPSFYTSNSTTNLAELGTPKKQDFSPVKSIRRNKSYHVAGAVMSMEAATRLFEEDEAGIEV